MEKNLLTPRTNKRGFISRSSGSVAILEEYPDEASRLSAELSSAERRLRRVTLQAEQQKEELQQEIQDLRVIVKEMLMAQPSLQTLVDDLQRSTVVWHESERSTGAAGFVGTLELAKENVRLTAENKQLRTERQTLRAEGQELMERCAHLQSDLRIAESELKQANLEIEKLRQAPITAVRAKSPVPGTRTPASEGSNTTQIIAAENEGPLRPPNSVPPSALVEVRQNDWVKSLLERQEALEVLLKRELGAWREDFAKEAELQRKCLDKRCEEFFHSQERRAPPLPIKGMEALRGKEAVESSEAEGSEIWHSPLVSGEAARSSPRLPASSPQRFAMCTPTSGASPPSRSSRFLHMKSLLRESSTSWGQAQNDFGDVGESLDFEKADSGKQSGWHQNAAAESFEDGPEGSDQAGRTRWVSTMSLPVPEAPMPRPPEPESFGPSPTSLEQGFEHEVSMASLNESSFNPRMRDAAPRVHRRIRSRRASRDSQSSCQSQTPSQTPSQSQSRRSSKGSSCRPVRVRRNSRQEQQPATGKGFLQVPKALPPARHANYRTAMVMDDDLGFDTEMDAGARASLDHLRFDDEGPIPQSALVSPIPSALSPTSSVASGSPAAAVRAAMAAAAEAVANENRDSHDSGNNNNNNSSSSRSSNNNNNMNRSDPRETLDGHFGEEEQERTSAPATTNRQDRRDSDLLTLPLKPSSRSQPVSRRASSGMISPTHGSNTSASTSRHGDTAAARHARGGWEALRRATLSGEIRSLESSVTPREDEASHRPGPPNSRGGAMQLVPILSASTPPRAPPAAAVAAAAQVPNPSPRPSFSTGSARSGPNTPRETRLANVREMLAASPLPKSSVTPPGSHTPRRSCRFGDDEEVEEEDPVNSARQVASCYVRSLTSHKSDFCAAASGADFDSARSAGPRTPRLSPGSRGGESTRRRSSQEASRWLEPGQFDIEESIANYTMTPRSRHASSSVASFHIQSPSATVPRLSHQSISSLAVNHRHHRTLSGRSGASMSLLASDSEDFPGEPPSRSPPGTGTEEDGVIGGKGQPTMERSSSYRRRMRRTIDGDGEDLLEHLAQFQSAEQADTPEIQPNSTRKVSCASIVEEDHLEAFSSATSPKIGRGKLVEGFFLLENDIATSQPCTRVRWPASLEGSCLEDAVVRGGFCPDPEVFHTSEIKGGFGKACLVFSLLETSLDPTGSASSVVFGCVCSEDRQCNADPLVMTKAKKSGLRNRLSSWAEQRFHHPVQQQQAQQQQQQLLSVQGMPSGDRGTGSQGLQSMTPHLSSVPSLGGMSHAASASSLLESASVGSGFNSGSPSGVLCLMTRVPLFEFMFDLLRIIREDVSLAGIILERVNEEANNGIALLEGLNFEDLGITPTILQPTIPRPLLCEWSEIVGLFDAAPLGKVSETAARLQSHWSLSVLLARCESQIGDILAKLLAAMLLEQKVLLIGDISKASAMALWLRAALWPFRWLHPFMSAPPPKSALRVPWLSSPFPFALTLHSLPEDWECRTMAALPSDVVCGVFKQQDQVHISPQLETSGGLVAQNFRLPASAHRKIVAQAVQAKTRLKNRVWDIRQAAEDIQKAIEDEVQYLADVLRNFVRERVATTKREVEEGGCGRRAGETDFAVHCKRCFDLDLFLPWLRQQGPQYRGSDTLPFYRTLFQTQLCIDFVEQVVAEELEDG